MRKTLLLLIVTVFAQTAFAQSFVQEANFSEITRRTGGSEYSINLNQPTTQLFLNIEGELSDSSNSGHKIQIHSISYVSALGITQVQSGSFLTGSSPKVSLDISSTHNITSIIIKAESWRSYHGMYVSVEGSSSTTTTTTTTAPQTTQYDDNAARLAEVEAIIRAEQEAANRNNNNDIARAQAEEAARRQAEEDAIRRAQAEEEARRNAEINAEIERRRQVECADNLHLITRSADQCVSYDLRSALDDYSKKENRLARVNRRLLEKQRPLNMCLKGQTARVNKVDALKNDYNSLNNNASKLKLQMNKLKSNTVIATATQYKCTMSNVGKKKRGHFVGTGATQALALMEAFKLCPRSSTGGCGKEKKLRADINCVKIQ